MIPRVDRLGGLSGTSRGRVDFEIHCAPCHHPSGEGGYLSPSARPPRIAGADVTQIVQHVREGGKEMPAFSAAVLSDDSLQDVASYVHGTLGRPAEPACFGPRELDPFIVGLVVWVALALFTCGLAALFGEGRR